MSISANFDKVCTEREYSADSRQPNTHDAVDFSQCAHGPSAVSCRYCSGSSCGPCFLVGTRRGGSGGLSRDGLGDFTGASSGKQVSPHRAPEIASPPPQHMPSHARHTHPQEHHPTDSRTPKLKQPRKPRALRRSGGLALGAFLLWPASTSLIEQAAAVRTFARVLPTPYV